MGSLSGLKNILIFSVILLTIGSVSAQQAFAGVFECELTSIQDGDWDSAFSQIPTSTDDVCIEHVVQLNGVGLADDLNINDGSLFIGCDGDLTTSRIVVFSQTSLINHGSVNTVFMSIQSDGLVQNSSSAFTFDDSEIEGTFENISSICNQVGGQLLPLDSTALLIGGLSTLTVWMVPTVLGLVGVGVYLVKFRKH